MHVYQYFSVWGHCYCLKNLLGNKFLTIGRLSNAPSPGYATGCTIDYIHNYIFLAVITRSETLTATAAAAAVLESICKVNKHPKSSTRTRQVNSTSKRPPSPPDPIHRNRSKYP
ncbi:unnamed protein product [Rotaria magnacalcarata]|uniref:Uncharacterized protein n=1 Tax=Rotaria magnacalcarata TaxID=392030 RepID=A0A818XHP0_9BILA|nr:unnamed protein product [Rotaria magnacalcarata]